MDYQKTEKQLLDKFGELSLAELETHKELKKAGYMGNEARYIYFFKHKGTGLYIERHSEGQTLIAAIPVQLNLEYYIQQYPSWDCTCCNYEA
jgi:hypothetical protein